MLEATGKKKRGYDARYNVVAKRSGKKREESKKRRVMGQRVLVGGLPATSIHDAANAEGGNRGKVGISG